MRVFILLSSFLSLTTFASSYCEKYPYKEPLAYSKITKTINDGLDELSTRKSIALMADKTLSSLAAAKSPLITKWISSRGLDPKTKEVEIVTQWRKYFLENFILSKFPAEDSSINSKIEEFFEEVNSQAFNSNSKKRIKNIFKDAKADALKYLQGLGLSVKELSVVSSRVKNIKLYFFTTLEGSKYEARPLDFLKWGLSFDPVASEINIGVDILKYEGDGELYSVFLHEIAHSFDPCRWSAFIKGSNIFARAITCLRSENSAGAKLRDDSKISLMIKSGRMSKEFAESLRSNKTCNNSIYPQVGMQKDQIGEVFADWFSAEVLSQENNKYLKPSFRSELCLNNALSVGSSYISNKERLNRIYFANPGIVKFFKIKPEATYCSFK